MASTYTGLVLRRAKAPIVLDIESWDVDAGSLNQGYFISSSGGRRIYLDSGRLASMLNTKVGREFGIRTWWCGEVPRYLQAAGPGGRQDVSMFDPLGQWVWLCVPQPWGRGADTAAGASGR